MALRKVPLYGVGPFFHDLDILVYVFAPEKIGRLVGRNFGLAICL